MDAWDPTGEKARQVKARHRGVCRGCGASTAPRSGKGDAYAYSSYDWSRTHARARGGDALARLQQGDWPAPGTVTDVYGTWAAARADAFRDT